jgi:prostamide/prostaglandin F2alpha synthase
MDQPGELHRHRPWGEPDVDRPGAAAPWRQAGMDRLHAARRWPWWMLDSVPARQRTSPPARADGLADISLPDHEARMVRLGDLWAGGPAVIVWLRQFGCPFCRSYAVRINRARGQFEQLGAPLVLIGQGTPREAAGFRRRFHIELAVLADADRASYLVAGTKLATLDELIGPSVLAKGIVAMAGQRVLIGHNTADEAQLGGAAIVVPGGEIPWTHLSEDAGDMAAPATILAELVKTLGRNPGRG